MNPLATTSPPSNAGSSLTRGRERGRLGHHCDVALSIVASTLRGWRGTMMVFQATPPPRPLQLFDMEGCPSCCSVREALTGLGLDAEVYPCPKGGARYRPRARALAGRELFPTLHDPSTGLTVVGKDRVTEYLFERYGKRSPPRRLLGLFGLSHLASGVRGIRGLRVRPSRRAPDLLELYSFESSPYARLVRERLCELEIPYLLHNMGKEQLADVGTPGIRLSRGPYRPVVGGKRAGLQERGGKVQIPFLVDGNTGAALYESREILKYLEGQYGGINLANLEGGSSA